MTELHTDLVALADRAPVPALDLGALLAAASARRRRRRLLLGVLPALVALSAALSLGTIQQQRTRSEQQQLTSLPLLSSRIDVQQRNRLLTIADQQAALAGGTPVTVTALRTTRQAYEAAAGPNGVPGNTPDNIWLVHVTGGSYLCRACLGLPGARPRTSDLSLIVDADGAGDVNFAVPADRAAPGDQLDLPGTPLQLRP